MASTIESFLKLKPKKQKTETVTVKLQGQDLDFEIREIEPSLLGEIQMANTVAIPSSVQGGTPVEGANPINLALDVCLEAIVDPDLRSSELQDHFRVATDRDLLYEMFKGDMASLSDLFEKIVNLSNSSNPEPRGMDSKRVQEAKN